MTGFAVDAAVLDRGDAALAATAAACRAALQPVRAEAATLLGAAWRGQAAAAFRFGWDDWLAGVEAMLDALEAMAALVGSSGTRYASTEAAVRASLSSPA